MGWTAFSTRRLPWNVPAKCKGLQVKSRYLDASMLSHFPNIGKSSSPPKNNSQPSVASSKFFGRQSVGMKCWSKATIRMRMVTFDKDIQLQPDQPCVGRFSLISELAVADKICQSCRSPGRNEKSVFWFDALFQNLTRISVAFIYLFFSCLMQDHRRYGNGQAWDVKLWNGSICSNFPWSTWQCWSRIAKSKHIQGEHGNVGPE